MTSDRGYRLDTTEEIISAEAWAGEHWTGAVSKLGGIVRLSARGKCHPGKLPCWQITILPTLRELAPLAGFPYRGVTALRTLAAPPSLSDSSIVSGIAASSLNLLLTPLVQRLGTVACTVFVSKLRRILGRGGASCEGTMRPSRRAARQRVQPFERIHHRSGMARPTLVGKQLQGTPAVLHRVVPRNPAPVLQAEGCAQARPRVQDPIRSL